MHILECKDLRKEYYSGENIVSAVDGITAAFENGVLTISVPSETKKEEPQEKQISIL